MNSLAGDLVQALDPVAFLAAAGVSADPWQADLLRARPHRAVLTASRQAGKSTVAAAVALHEARYGLGGGVAAIVSPTQRQSSEMLKRVLALARDFAEPLRLEAVSAQAVTLADNGARIVSLPGDAESIRGYSARLLVVDEGAFVPDEVFAAASPMLAATNGRLIALSTPMGRHGWFFEAAAGDDHRWYRVRVTADQVDRITSEFLEAERASMPEHRFRREYFCEFGETLTGAFHDPDAMFADVEADHGGANPFDVAAQLLESGAR